MKKRGFTAFLFRVVAITIVILFALLMVDFIRFPECYISTMKYHLQNDIKRGDKEAIEYYNETYVAHGRILFENLEH